MDGVERRTELVARACWLEPDERAKLVESVGTQPHQAVPHSRDPLRRGHGLGCAALGPPATDEVVSAALGTRGVVPVAQRAAEPDHEHGTGCADDEHGPALRRAVRRQLGVERALQQLGQRAFVDRCLVERGLHADDVDHDPHHVRVRRVDHHAALRRDAGLLVRHHGTRGRDRLVVVSEQAGVRRALELQAAQSLLAARPRRLLSLEGRADARVEAVAAIVVTSDLLHSQLHEGVEPSRRARQQRLGG